MIRLLRRRLLGVEPDGPPLLADPLYRWEVRRYWTWRRYAAVAGAAVAGCVMAALVVIGSLKRPYWDLDTALAASASALFALICRIPLEFTAVLGGALSVVPERSTGEFEQFMLTPLDPWRLARARYFARVQGTLRVWVLVGLPLIVLWPGALLLSSKAGPGNALGTTWRTWLTLCLVLGIMHLDWGLMLLVDGANGLRFSTTAKGVPSAVVQSLLRSFLTIPLMLAIAAASGMIMGMLAGLMIGWTKPSWLWVAGAILFRMGMGLVILTDDLSRSRRGTERICFQPGEAA
ncbi:MAG TPA: hypothetical protein PK280_21460 [Planctomycetota bacterium]|nr:hypothetical protein [Planctomycetota bacterium]